MRKLILLIVGMYVSLSIAICCMAPHYTRMADRLEQEATNGGQDFRKNIRFPEQQKPPPVNEQPEIDDFPPTKVVLEGDILVSTDPELRRKGELAIEYRHMAEYATTAIWFIPAMGLMGGLMLWMWIRMKRENKAQIAPPLAEVASDQPPS